MESRKESFNFLHLSDLHVGLLGQEFLWPNIKKQFLEDLKALGEKNGGWDLVIFSGDLTQKGSQDEFNRLNEYLREIWNVFKQFDKETKLFVVPGNHDLTRLKKTSLIASFSQWWTHDGIRNEFWGSEDNEFKIAVKDAFSNYQNWLESLPNLGIKLAIDSKGVIPGDCAGVLNVANMKIGLMGLNSAWLQLSGGDYEGQLDIGIQQFHKVTNGDVNAWLELNDINFLITHHPDDWLHKVAKDCFDNEINCAGKFHAHLFGHMHDSDSVATSIAGGVLKRSIQGSSLFGLEYFNGNEERVHGYSSFELKKLDADKKIEMKVSPRLAHKVKGIGWKLIPNFHFNLKNECYTEFIDVTIGDYSNSNDSFSTDPKDDHAFSALTSSNEAGILDQLKCKLKRSERHFHIREMETSSAVDSLKDNRYLWIVSDWEMGLEEFLTVVKFKLNDEMAEVYRLDLSGFVNCSQFSDDSVAKIGCSIEKLCQLISDRPHAYLILEDVPIGNEKIHEDVESEMDRLLGVILSYCDSLKIILVSRDAPKNSDFKVVEIHALNEADIRAYLRAAYDGTVVESRIVSEAGFIFRYSNGVPSLIDKMIKDLEVLSLDELAMQKDIISTQTITSFNAPSALVNVVSSLKNSESNLRTTAFDLLCVLSIFPHGERFEFLKKFNRTKFFSTEHVHILRESALIDFHQSAVVGAKLAAPATHLIIRRVVCGYVLSLLDDEVKQSLYEKAIALYFGEYWLNGRFKVNSQAKFSDTNISSSVIENSNELIRWLFAGALELDDQKRLALATRLLYFYLDKLERGDHFREISNLCGFLVAIISGSKHKESIARIKLIYAQSLRMIGEYEKSSEVSNDLIEGQKEKSVLARSYINLAYCYKSLGKNDLAISKAEEVERISKGTPIARAAKALILKLTSTTGEKIKGLKKLEVESKKNNEIINLNNIRISIARDINNLDARAEHYKETLGTAIKHSDGYNAVRALIYYCQALQGSNKSLPDREKRSLMYAYQFLYSQRISYVFNVCHDVLWKEFSKDGDIQNLIELFRHSSLVWRLSSDEGKEIKYATSMLDTIASVSGGATGRGFLYLVSRSRVLNIVEKSE